MQIPRYLVLELTVILRFIILVPAGICRICLQECATRDLISPCSCRGTLAHVHRHCFSDMVSAMKKEKCDICGTHFERLSPRLRTWREWKWTLPDGFWNADPVFYGIMLLHCVMCLIDRKRLERDWEKFRTIYGSNSWLSFLVWLQNGPLFWGIYVVLTYSLLNGVTQFYIAAKHWIADNTVYEWREGGALKSAA